MARVSYVASARALVRLTWARTITPALLVGMAFLVLLPILFAIAFAGRGPLSGDPVVFLVGRYDQLVCAIAVPILALLLGTSAFVAEADDGTLVYLVTTTTPRWWIAFVRVMFAAVGAALLSAFSVWGAGRIAAGPTDPQGVTAAFVVASALGAATYASGFTALALLTRRALVVGLVYVLFWEGVLSSTFPALHYLSVRQWMLAIASSMTDATEQRLVDGPAASAGYIGSAVVFVLALLIATQRLARPRLWKGGS